MTTVRKSLHTLQKAAGDKENLVGPGRMPSTTDKEPLKDSLRDVNNEICEKSSDLQAKLPKRKKTTSKGVQAGTQKRGPSTSVSESDLIKETPSEKYWEVLAEQRRIALEVALQENEDLHKQKEELQKRITVLQEEVVVYKEMMKESETLVEVLKEMVGGDTTNDDSQLIDNSYEA